MKRHESMRMAWMAMGLCGALSSQAAIRIHSIQVKVNGDTDVPRMLELFGMREGDEYTDVAAERGLIRLADTGKFLGIQTALNETTGDLMLRASIVPRVGAIEAKLSKAAGDSSDVTALESEVVDVVGLSPGDPIFPDQLASIRDRVLTRVRDRGYHQAKAVVALEEIDSLSGMNVSIAVDLGVRSEIRHLTLRGFSPADLTQTWLMLGLSQAPAVSSLQEGIQVDIKVPYDVIALNEESSAWNMRARAQGYYDFQLQIFERERGPEADLVLELKRGPRYDLQFRGNVALWERDLRALVTDRALRLGVPLSVQEAETMIVRAYEKVGYPEVVVTSTMTDKGDVRLIVFNIVENRKLLLGNIRLLGVSDTEAQATNAVLDEWVKVFRNPFARTVFDERRIRSELPSLVSKIRSMGYLDVRILEFRPLIELGNKRVDVEIPLQLGEKYIIRSVDVNGNLSLSDEELERIVDISPGDAVDPLKIAAIRDALIRKYKSIGFLDAALLEDEAHTIRRIPESFDVDVRFTVDQGPLIRVGTPVLEGLRRTRDGVVLRELTRDTLQPGALWTPQGAEALEQRLLGLSIFGSVAFEPVGGKILERGQADGSSIEVQEKDLKIAVTERPAGTVEFGPGFRTDKGVIGFAEMNYRNLGGWNRSAQLRTQVSRRLKDNRILEQNYSFTYLEPYIFTQRMRFRFNTQFDRADKYLRRKGGVASSGYASQTESFAFGTETEIAKNLRWIHNLYTLAFTNQFDVLDDPEIPGQESGTESKFRVATIGTTLNYDNRDNIFNPTRGWLLTSAAEYSSPEIGSRALDGRNLDVGFAKFRQEAATYFKLRSDVVFALFAAYTKLWALGSVPQDNRPTLGGVASIRALPENALRFWGDDVDSQEAYELRAEYRQPIVYDLGVAYFVDMGKINALAINSTTGVHTRLTTGIRSGLGVGLRYKTVVGPISVDVAYNMNPVEKDGKSLEDLVRVVFRIGAF